MKTFTYYQYMQWDGGDRHHPKEPAFFDKADAAEFLKNKKYDRFENRTITIYESLEDYEEIANGKLKETALAKLTEKEKKALGLL